MFIGVFHPIQTAPRTVGFAAFVRESSADGPDVT